MQRLTGNTRNFDGTGFAMESLVNDNGFLTDFTDKVLTKLADYEDAEEQRLLLRLPCKIGDDVFFIPSKPKFDLNILHRREAFNRVYHQKIARIHIAEEHWYLEGNLNLEYGIDRLFVDKEYKEVWFLTREEAEQALKQMGE